MPTKLTLSIDAEVIARAKDFAKKSNRSLSQLIESYLIRITESSETKDIDLELASIVGIIDLADDFDEKKFRREQRLSKQK
jgi:hypothetical protein